ncbi:MAG: PD-(D/E)XK nuclease family protein, partial [Muribaculaceae bacterium]|nr:PD-(D/E)XK nuclease family protein [Muribaculaceae bacterium]
TISVAELRGISQEMGDVLDPTRLGEIPQEVVEYIRYVLNKVKEKLPKEESVGIKSRLDEDHIEIYLRALQRLSDLLDEYAINMRQATVFRLVDRILAGETVGFKGEPLTGLQVMGSLETRSIDFEHLFVLSMNEKIMPMRARRRTFIPDSLRHAYGMPPSNYAESIFAYYFYRMISRAKEVTLLYDARNSGGISSGYVSRYIVQLRELFAKGEIEEEEWKFTLTGKTESESDIAKTEDVMKLLQPYEDEKSKKNFSASSLNDYRECQARFFYRDVMGINTDPALSEFIDAIGVGNILHELMEALYLPPELRGK